MVSAASGTIAKVLAVLAGITALYIVATELMKTNVATVSKSS
jgi:hypothetical protein